MVTRDTAWGDGTPCWVDLGVADIAKAGAFYANLFGWEVHQGPPEVGGYALCLKDGRLVAGIAPKMGPPGERSAWTTYLAASNADETAGKIKASGGHVLVEPMDVMDQGRMVMAADPGGAVFGLWQARNHIGAQRVNEPGAMCWNECMTYDAAAARDFYAMVFSFRYGGLAHDQYTLIARPSEDVGPETAIGGIGQLDPAWAGRIPAHWMTYFAVADVDAATGKVTRGGGQVLGGPRDTPYGRTAVCEDPQGAVFSIITLPVTS